MNLVIFPLWPILPDLFQFLPNFLTFLFCKSSRIIFNFLKDFKVGNLLGKGSFAGVYRAESIHTGLEVAIKMVRMY